MNKIEQNELEIEVVKSKIEAVETALLSFVLHGDDESRRIGYLKDQFQQKGFLIYINFSEQRLQEEMGKLEDRLNIQLKLQLREIPEQGCDFSVLRCRFDELICVLFLFVVFISCCSCR
jgi:hypothetical protein